MTLVIIGYALLALVGLAFMVIAFRDFVVKRMSEAFEMGKKMEILRQQLGQETVDQMMRDAGIEPTELPGRAA